MPVAFRRPQVGLPLNGTAPDGSPASGPTSTPTVAAPLRSEWTTAAIALDRHNADHPHDVVALQSGHLMDFYRASSRGLRDRIARVLPKWSAETPGYSILLGMHAFGLEETGDFGRAEEAGRRALDLQPLDC
ncbi:hypothetical protein [Mesorhizobium sp.]|uniref:hypothetical protein n=1 Tax=Mesorhizobium sp. TaxID=1871066 RepID=UPI0025F88EE6|nr:hypothetical protein [Mesorhizobium sp.]